MAGADRMNAVDIIIEDEAWKSLGDMNALAKSAVKAASAELPASSLRPGAVAILFADDATLADLNGRFRSKTGPTNVLSFPAGETGANQLGDIALAWGVCAAEADAAGKSRDAHALHLILHGFLHLQGYDHQTDEEAEHMEGIERRALASLGIPDPYEADGSEPDALQR